MMMVEGFAENPVDVNTLITKGIDLYTQYIEPKLTKENIYNTVTGTIGFSTYYAMAPSVDQTQNGAFIKRAGISIGFKLFDAFVTPAVAPFVESFAEVNVNNAKYSYYSIRCLFEIKYCDEAHKLPNTFTHNELTQQPLWQDFSQFNIGAYLQKIQPTTGELTPQSLCLNGMISATAAELKDFLYITSGFDQYCQGDFCKGWVSYYFEEWLKNDIKSSIDISLTQEPTYMVMEFEQYCQDDVCQNELSYHVPESPVNTFTIPFSEVILFESTTPMVVETKVESVLVSTHVAVIEQIFAVNTTPAQVEFLA